MLKFFTILFIAVFATVGNASLLSDSLDTAQSSLHKLLDNTIEEVKSTVDDAKKKSNEIATNIEKKAYDYKEKITKEVEKRLQNAMDDVSKLTNNVDGLNVTDCNQLATQLHFTARIAIQEMKKCFTEKRKTATDYLRNMIKVSDGVLDQLHIYKEDARGCIDQAKGILTGGKALLCTNLVAAKAAWMTAKSLPAMSIEIAKLTFLLTTLPPSLTYCTTTSALATFYYEASTIAGRTKKCVEQRIDELRQSTPHYYATTVKSSGNKEETTVDNVQESEAAPSTTITWTPEGDLTTKIHNSGSETSAVPETSAEPEANTTEPQPTTANIEDTETTLPVAYSESPVDNE